MSDDRIYKYCHHCNAWTWWEIIWKGAARVLKCTAPGCTAQQIESAQPQSTRRGA